MKTILNIFDFDDTLIRTVGPEANRLLNMVVDTGITNDDLNKRRLNWWENDLCIDDKYFNMSLIVPVYSFYEKYADDHQAINMVITNRREKQRHAVDFMLQKHGIHPDYLIMNGGDFKGPKSAHLKDMLGAHPTISSINIFEDNLAILLEYANTLFLIGYGGESFMCMVNANNIIVIEPHEENGFFVRSIMENDIRY